MLLLCLGIAGAPAWAGQPRNAIVNGGFESSLSGWSVEGDAATETVRPLSGEASLRLGPGRGLVRQRYPVGGLRILQFSAILKPNPIGTKGALRIQCYDAAHHLLMDEMVPLGPVGPDTKGRKESLYFKTQANTSLLVVSIEKEGGGYLNADDVELFDYDVDNQERAPLCDLDQYLRPFWKGTTVFNEPVLLISQDGKPASGNLLFTPQRIISVQDSALSTRWTNGADYVSQSNTLIRLTGSRISSMRDADFSTNDLSWADLSDRHILVTYTHNQAWRGPVPRYQGEHLPQTMAKLTARRPLTIVADGDSIVLGANASGFRNVPPYMPGWADLFVDRLKTIYGYKAIHLLNAGLGGMTSEWGKDTACSAVASLKPDLVIIAFGMSDFWSISRSEFKANVHSMIQQVRAQNPNAEFLLVSPMQFDPAYTSDPAYAQRLASYAGALQALTGEGIRLVDMTGLSQALYAAKKPKDFLTDPLHPNDFLARCYAQALVALVEKDSRE